MSIQLSCSSKSNLSRLQYLSWVKGIYLFIFNFFLLCIQVVWINKVVSFLNIKDFPQFSSKITKVHLAIRSYRPSVIVATSPEAGFGFPFLSLNLVRYWCRGRQLWLTYLASEAEGSQSRRPAWPEVINTLMFSVLLNFMLEDAKSADLNLFTKFLFPYCVSLVPQIN